MIITIFISSTTTYLIAFVILPFNAMIAIFMTVEKKTLLYYQHVPRTVLTDPYKKSETVLSAFRPSKLEFYERIVLSNPSYR